MLFIALVAACATHFYSFIIGNPEKGIVHNGRLFSVFGRWLEQKYHDFEYQEDLRMNEIFKTLTERERERLIRRRKLNWFKPLGMCPVCTNPYFAAVLYMLFCAMEICDFHVVWLLSVILLSNFFLRATLKDL